MQTVSIYWIPFRVSLPFQLLWLIIKYILNISLNVFYWTYSRDINNMLLLGFCYIICVIITYKLNISNVSCDSVLLFFFLSNFHDSCSFPLGNLTLNGVLPEKLNINLYLGRIKMACFCPLCKGGWGSLLVYHLYLAEPKYVKKKKKRSD